MLCLLNKQSFSLDIGEAYVARWRGGIVFASLAQVWGDSALEQTISQFYRLHQYSSQGVQAHDFTMLLHRQLPDSLHYLTSYLNNQFVFRFQVGRISRQPTDLAVEVLPEKWALDRRGHRYSVAPKDLVPIVLVDDSGKERYRALVRPASNQPPFWLPLIEGVNEVVIDPLGAWLGNDQRANRKLF